MKKTIVLFGASGLLGSNFIKMMNRKYKIYGVYNQKKPSFKREAVKIMKINLSNSYSSIKKKLSNINPDIVINFAGISDVDFCEKNKKITKIVNYESCKKILNFAKENNSYLIYISTDSLFSKKKFSNEKQKTSPVNFYSKIKILCENYINEKYKNSVIIRTRFFGLNNVKKEKNFLEQILYKLKKKQKIYCYDNLFSTPIGVKSLIRFIDILIRSRKTGTYNIVSNERLSRYEFAKIVSNVFKLDKDFLVKTKYFPRKKINKPLDTSLSNMKFKKTFNIKINSIEKDLTEIRRNEK